MASNLEQLQERAERGARDFTELARAALGEQLTSIVLFGSAAEGRLRASSDVNLIVLLSGLDLTKLETLREPLRLWNAAIRLHVMFALEAELDELVEAFADKFADVSRRRRVLFGKDPFAERMPSRRAQIARLRQSSLNLVVRMRERYLLTSLREEQATRSIAQLSGSLRVLAADLLALEGRTVTSPREALEQLAAELGDATWAGQLSMAREGGALPAGAPSGVLRAMLSVVSALHARSVRLVDEAT